MTADIYAIQEHMEVIGSDGRHVGDVDHVLDRDIKLTRRDSEAVDGKHHLIPFDWVERVAPNERKVFLNCTQAEAEKRWRPVQ